MPPARTDKSGFRWCRSFVGWSWPCRDRAGGVLWLKGRGAWNFYARFLSSSQHPFCCAGTLKHENMTVAIGYALGFFLADFPTAKIVTLLRFARQVQRGLIVRSACKGYGERRCGSGAIDLRLTSKGFKRRKIFSLYPVCAGRQKRDETEDTMIKVQ